MQITTTAPISIDNLKKYFIDKSLSFDIDYKNSSLKGSKLLVYLSNLDVPVDIKIEYDGDFYNLIKDYMESSFIVNVKSLEMAVIEILFCSRKLLNETKHNNFIEQNKTLIQEWSSKLDSLTLYNLYMVNEDTFKEFVDGYPLADSLTTGVNFVNLLKHEVFYSFYQAVDKDGLKNYKGYFNEYMFKGKNLFSFWANENNPLFLLTFGISEGLVKHNKDTNLMEVL